jgi:hypothetical protein
MPQQRHKKFLRHFKKTEKRFKPDPVLNHHSSRPIVAYRLEHSTRLASEVVLPSPPCDRGTPKPI